MTNHITAPTLPEHYRPGPASLATALADLRAGTITARALTEAALARAREINHLIGAFSFLDDDAAALARADQIDEEIAAARAAAAAQPAACRDAAPGDGPASDQGTPDALDEYFARHPLAGIPTAIKALSQVEGWPYTGGSAALAGNVGARDDGIVQRWKQAGAIAIGLSASPEFGLAAYTEPDGAPPARTPWDLRRGAGGSSGGAATAVASGILTVAHGSDGGGSLRIPAGCCGLVAMKGSRGLVSRGPHSVDGPGLICEGALTHSVLDQAIALQALAHQDPGDAYLARQPQPQEYLAATIAGWHDAALASSAPAGGSPASGAPASGAPASGVDPEKIVDQLEDFVAKIVPSQGEPAHWHECVTQAPREQMLQQMRGQMRQQVRAARALISDAQRDGIIARYLSDSAPRLRIGVLTAPVVDDRAEVEPQAVAAVDRTVAHLRTLGHEICQAPVPITAEQWMSFMPIWAVGALLPLPEQLEPQLTPLTRWLRELGRGYSAHEYAQASAALQLIAQQVAERWAELDVVISPTLATAAPLVGTQRMDNDPEGDFLAQKAFTPWSSVYNIVGNPAISLPIHRAEKDGVILPYGVQLAAPRGEETRLFRLASAIELLDPWPYFGFSGNA